MIKILAKLFIADFRNYEKTEVRTKYGILCGALGILFNVFLFTIKLVAGIISNSVSVFADAFNNLSDAAASITTVIGFKLSSKKPDAKHPFGHGRIEYIAALIVSFFIILMGWELLKSSVHSFRVPVPLETGLFTVVSLVISILVKFYMFMYNRLLGKKLKSSVLTATSKDSLNDMITSSVVLAVILVIYICKKMNCPVTFPLDETAGILVSLFIIKSGISSVIDTSDPLLGKTSDKELVEHIEKTVQHHKMVSGIHDLIIHDYGAGRVMVTFHAEVPGNRNIFEVHNEIDRIESEISGRFSCSCLIHMDPVDLNNPEIEVIKEKVLQEGQKIEPALTIHDLRIVNSLDKTKVIFDAILPFESKISEEEVKQALKKIVKDYNPLYRPIVQIDRPFV